ncbi:tyrosine-type recombinase/integrase [Bacteroidota bacterium]
MVKKIWINCNLRSQKSKKPTPIHMVVRWKFGGLMHRVTLNSQKKIEPRYFISHENQIKNRRDRFQRVMTSYQDHHFINKELDKITSKAEQLYHEYYENHDENPDLETFRELLYEGTGIKRQAENVEVPKKSFFKEFEAWIDSSRHRTNTKTERPISSRTRQNYTQALTTIRAYNPNLTFEDIDMTFYDGYLKYAHDGYGLKLSTVGKHIGTLKGFLQDTFDRKIHENLIFRAKSFRTPKTRNDNLYLTVEDLNEIKDLEITDAKYDRVRDIFLLTAYSGLRVSDIVELKPENIGRKVMNVATIKSRKVVSIPILPEVRRIIDKYNGPPPMMTEQKLNKYIKDICAEATSLKLDYKLNGEVRKKYQWITWHTARRSFARNAYDLNWFNPPGIKPIQAILGHSKESQTWEYIGRDASAPTISINTLAFEQEIKVRSISS